MRRKDREITSEKRVNEIIAACNCCRLGLADGVGTYVVPLSFGYTAEDGKRIFYFHCAGEGKKLALLKANPNVGFELDTNHALVRGETGCSFTFLYSSVMGKGTVETVTELEEKKTALSLIVVHYGGPAEWRCTDAEAKTVTVLKLTVTEISYKEHR